jgi:hypothetical protein
MNAKNVAATHEFESPASENGQFRTFVRPAIELGKLALEKVLPTTGDIFKWEANRLEPQLEAVPTGPLGLQPSTQAGLDYMRFLQRTEGLPADESARLDQIVQNSAGLGDEDSDWLRQTARTKPGFLDYEHEYDQYATYFDQYSIGDDPGEIDRHREGLDGNKNKPPR